MSSPIKTAFIGFGFSAKTFHISFINFLDEFTLMAISSNQGDAIKVHHHTVGANKPVKVEECYLI